MLVEKQKEVDIGFFFERFVTETKIEGRERANERNASTVFIDPVARINRIISTLGQKKTISFKLNDASV